MKPEQAHALVAETFPKAFDRVRFHQFAKELLNGFNEDKTAAMGVPDAYAPHVRSCVRLGTYESPEGEFADVLIVNTTEPWKLERTRTALRDFVAHKLKRGDSYKEAGLVAFVAPDARSWRFSFLRMEYESKRDPKTGKIAVEERLTPARRFSYIVGENESCHTAQSRFLDLLQDTENKPTLTQIEKAFSVEAVTKEFFEQYKTLFLDLKDEVDRLAKKDKTIGAEFAAKKISTADFAKKLMGQIVFLYFLQKKGWLGVPKGGDWGDGPHNFLRQLFDGKFHAHKNFFNDLLEPLFYDTLATDRGHEAMCKIFNCRIPFLNGGLFEPLAGYDWQKTDIIIPNSFFANNKRNDKGDTGTGILDVFDRYNFTVNEAEPLEKEVAIDPEMLGKVFENLLEVKERKSKGSFYTPREIVHYMCQESLINYLDTAVNSSAETIGREKRKQAEFGDEKAEQTLLTAAVRKELIPRAGLETFIHSGDQASHYEAARVEGTGYARKLPKTIETHARLIDEKLADIAVCDPAIGSGAFPVGMMQEIVRARSALTPYFNDVHDRTAYRFKRHAIQNCLYGVDIDPGAVEIAKLRLWLSLVVDEEDVKQVKPLPNLDYKIVAGNSLMGFPFKSQRQKEIEKLKLKFFDEPNHDIKANFKKQIDAALSACFAAAKKSLGYEVTFDFESFFSEIFTEKGGFDVVIGNPPYINIEKIPQSDRAVFLQIYGENGKIGQRYDIYQLFIMKGMVINAKGGTLAYILPNTFLTGSSYLILRRRLCARTSILGIVDLPKDVFESAMVDNVLLFLHRENRRQHLIQIAKLHTDSDIEKIAAKDWDDSFTIPQENLNEDNEFKLNVHMNPVLQQFYRKIESGSDKLGDVTESSQGIIIYTTEADAQRNRYTSTSAQAQKGWKKLLRGTNIGYYCTKWGGEYLHYGEWLCRRRDEMFFNQPKLLLQAMRNKSLKRRLVATYDEDCYYNAHNLANIISKRDSGYDLKFILAILNSALINHWYRNHFPNVNINPNDFREIPIHVTNSKEQAPFIKLVDRILAAKQRDAEADTSALEREIDELVYALYGLTPEEIKIVEEGNS